MSLCCTRGWDGDCLYALRIHSHTRLTIKQNLRVHHFMDDSDVLQLPQDRELSSVTTSTFFSFTNHEYARLIYLTSTLPGPSGIWRVSISSTIISIDLWSENFSVPITQSLLFFLFWYSSGPIMDSMVGDERELGWAWKQPRPIHIAHIEEWSRCARIESLGITTDLFI